MEPECVEEEKSKATKSQSEKGRKETEESEDCGWHMVCGSAAVLYVSAAPARDENRPAS